jgi:hypothetical protein
MHEREASAWDAQPRQCRILKLQDCSASGLSMAAVGQQLGISAALVL